MCRQNGSVFCKKSLMGPIFHAQILNYGSDFQIFNKSQEIGTFFLPGMEVHLILKFCAHAYLEVFKTYAYTFDEKRPFLCFFLPVKCWLLVTEDRSHCSGHMHRLKDDKKMNKVHQIFTRCK